ncbi:MAG: hypothetical protein ABW196_06920 [Solirubrobacterales bacterium]
MLGGAYAASNDGGNATASAKAKKGPPGPRGKTGPAGPAGPQGPAGPAGAKGDTGAAGSNGSNGSNGQNVTGTSFAGSKGGCTEGGVEFVAASGTTFACNGKKGTNGTNGTNGAPGAPGPEGSPWTIDGTLPSGKTETGAWSSLGGEFAVVPISFSIPLAAEIEGPTKTHLLKKGFPGADKTACEAESEPEKAECLAELETLEESCPGSAKEPKAAKDRLCVYTGAGSFDGESLIAKPGGNPGDFGASRSGANLVLLKGVAEFGFFLQGTWAVTAP